jgi:histidine triad (HIT) family protein
MSTKECLFCKMVAGRIPVTKIYEDDVVLSFLDIRPISDGHTLVVPKQHFEMLHECPAEQMGLIASRISRIAKAVVDAMDCEGYNLLNNNGRSAGQLIEHLHFHIIPRNAGDGLFERWPSYEYQQGRIGEIAAEIRKNL